MSTNTVTVRTLVRRINRKLAREELVLRVTRERWHYDLGAFHVVSFGQVLDSKLDNIAELEEFGRDLGCLARYESVE